MSSSWEKADWAVMMAQGIREILLSISVGVRVMNWEKWDSGVEPGQLSEGVACFQSRTGWARTLGIQTSCQQTESLAGVSCLAGNEQ